jgi:hypothetical protein
LIYPILFKAIAPGLRPGRGCPEAADSRRACGSGFALTVYGDVGGFGLAAHTDWQVVGTIDYALRSSIDLHLGYRSLNVNYSLNNRPVGFDVNLNGPIIAGTFRF